MDCCELFFQLGMNPTWYLLLLTPEEAKYYYFFFWHADSLSCCLFGNGGETSLNDPSGRSVLPLATKVVSHSGRDVRIPRRLSCFEESIILNLGLLGVRVACLSFFEAVNNCMCYA